MRAVGGLLTSEFRVLNPPIVSTGGLWGSKRNSDENWSIECTAHNNAHTWHLGKADSTRLAARVSRIAPLQLLDRETRRRRRRTSNWRTGAEVAGSALARVGKRKSRTSTLEFDTHPTRRSVVAMRRRKSDHRNGRFEMEKNRRNSTERKSFDPLAPAKRQDKYRKETNQDRRICGYLDALR
jgi:hypothetical protein